jgi:hypothetical protein
MPFTPQQLGQTGGFYTQGLSGSDPLNAPLYKQQAAMNAQDAGQAQKLQQGQIQGQLQVGQQTGDIQKSLESMKEGSALQLGQQSGDIQKALQSTANAFTGQQHQLDISQAQWLQNAQASLQQKLQSGQISAQEYMQQQDLANKTNVANIANQPALAQLGFKEDVFGKVFPWFQGMMNGFAGGMGGAGGFGGAGGGSGFGAALGATGGTGSAGSGINPAAMAPTTVMTPQMIQQQINASRAQNDSQTKAGQAQNAAKLGGQGFGSGSPLLAALNNQMAGQNMQTNSANALNTQLSGAQMNAQQATQAAQIAAGLQQSAGNNAASNYSANLQAQSAARQTQASQFNALLSALSGII